MNVNGKEGKIDRKDLAVRLFNSVRGNYIVGQALYLAMEHIKERPEIRREPSNMADMELIMEELFPLYSDGCKFNIVAGAEKAFKKDTFKKLDGGVS
jgi:hypothetical protein